MSHLNPPPAVGYLRVYENPDGGYVDVHELHGRLEKPQNLAIALWLAARGERVCLLPVTDEPRVKSPDATRNGVSWEFKIPAGSTSNSIDKALRDGSKQAPRILLKLPVEFDRQVLQVALVDRVQRTATIQSVAVLLGQQLASFTRQDILSGIFQTEMP